MASNSVVGITNLRLKYPGEDPLIFKGLSFSVKRGEKVLLLGPSGCGKSTLLQVLSGLIPNVVEVPMKADDIVIPSQWGFVFQDPDAQFCMPYVDEELAFVLENLQVPRAEMPPLIRTYLECVGLHFEENHIPIQQLSQGMKQRLAIASALALQPDVLFLDEPTALLDQEGTSQVWSAIKEAAADKTVLIVEHKVEGILDFIDRIALFAPDGRILADGSPDEVFRNHKQELIEYGIWYPGVWDDYERLPAGRGTADQSPGDPAGSKKLIEFREFQGFRGGKECIRVKEAVVHPGEWIAVVGENGAGKSSLLLAMMRLLKTDGVCLVRGENIRKVDQLAEHVAFVFQNPEFQFVTNSVEEEVAYSLKEQGMAPDLQQTKVSSLLQRYDLSHLCERHPYQLSMGQKRRLSVAAAMVREQDILLLDEPTFGLDARNTFAMLETLEELRAGGTAIVMVTHDYDIVERFATRVWHVDEGRICADVTSEAFLKRSGFHSASGCAVEGGELPCN